MPRFVILEHDHPFRHWDLMLEHGTALRTWRLVKPPSAGAPVPADALANHRLHYLEYEGPVSGNRGTVSQWDKGMYDGLVESESGVEFRLAGKKVRGKCGIRMDAGGYQLIYRPSD
jgi:hypothetical protein